MSKSFEIIAGFEPTGDQPEAIEKLSKGLAEGKKFQTLEGVTGSGKTFTIANAIALNGRPALVLSHNKTLAAQLYAELKAFFPNNSVQYFVSYYDYYQPEAYIPQTDTFIEKDSAINEEIERLRLAGGAPLAIDRAWLPYTIAAPLLSVDWARTALYAELAKAELPVPNHGWERLTPRVPVAADRAKLGLQPKDAVFFLERLGSRNGLVIEWRTTIIRGDRYRFVTDWSAGGHSELRPVAA